MLTKDLIQCRSQKGFLKPQFVSVEDGALLELASQLLALYAPERGLLRGDIEEQSEPLVNGSSKPRVARGIQKVIEDSASYSTPRELDYAAARRQLFSLSAKLLQGGNVDESGYQQALSEGSRDYPLKAGEPYFADLPENDRLTQFKGMNSRQVLERYNTGLVQGLLLRTSRLEVVVSDEEPARLRRLFKYLKFFRLMASARRDAATGGVRFEVDGPASVLEQSKRYGFQLALFFPAVCSLRHWKIRAEVEWQERQHWLVLDDSSGLVCPYHNFAAVVPEEVGLFERHFRETATGWRILDETPFLTWRNQELFFPDFAFESSCGVQVHLELFHRWHGTQLLARLEYCEDHPELPLIMGVDRALLRDAETQERLDGSGWFARHGFLFRDYPTVDRTLRKLNNQLQDNLLQD